MADPSKHQPSSTSEVIAEAFRNSEVMTEATAKAAKLALRQHKLVGYPVALSSSNLTLHFYSSKNGKGGEQSLF